MGSINKNAPIIEAEALNGALTIWQGGRGWVVEFPTDEQADQAMHQILTVSGHFFRERERFSEILNPVLYIFGAYLTQQEYLDRLICVYNRIGFHITSGLHRNPETYYFDKEN